MADFTATTFFFTTEDDPQGTLSKSRSSFSFCSSYQSPVNQQNSQFLLYSKKQNEPEKHSKSLVKLYKVLTSFLSDDHFATIKTNFDLSLKNLRNCNFWDD